MDKRKTKIIIFIGVIVAVFLTIFAYTQRNQSFDSVGNVFSAIHANNAEMEDEEEESVPTVLRWRKSFN